MRRFSLLSVIAVAALIAAPSANAATTIGVDLAIAPNNNTTCGGNGCTQATTSVGTAAVAPGGFTAPSAGVIVRWRVRTSAAEQETGPVDAVFRVIAGNHGAGSSAPVELADEDDTQEFPTRIPIAGGSRLGLDIGATDFFGTVNVASATRDIWLPPLADGVTLPPDDTFAGQIIPLNADLEPDADGDGFGDETQDQCPGQAGTNNGCPPPPPGTAPTGQRAAAKKKCQKKFPKGPKRKKCIKKAKKLPV